MTVRLLHHPWLLGTLVYAASACGTDTDLSDRADDVAPDSRDALDAGSASEVDESRIVEAQAFLSHYGYLPQEGATAYRPFVQERPTQGELDQPTQDALRIYQSRNALTPTGQLDAETWTRMHEARCGNTDAQRPGDVPGPIEKYAAKDGIDFSTVNSLSLRVLRYPASSTGLSQSEVHEAIDGAAEQISKYTGARIARTDASDPKIEAYFYTGTNPPAGCPAFPNDPRENRLAVTVLTYETGSGRVVDTKLCVNTRHDYDDSDDSAFDLQSLILHELGHAIGFDHSDVSAAVMTPSLPKDRTRRSLHPDDLTGMRAKHGDWERDNGSIAARDIAWSYDNVLWGISNTERSGGYEIWKRPGTRRDAFNGVLGPWEKVSGGAVRITVHENTPWVVNSAGAIYRRKADDSGWEQVPGCATDIGANKVGIWIVGCENAPEGGGKKVYSYVWLWNGWEHVPGVGASRIAVDSTGRPWIVQTDNDIYTRNTAGWVKPSGSATDVGSQPGGGIWIIGTDGGIYHRNYQDELLGVDTEGNPTVVIPYRNRWVKYPSTGSVVAAAPWSNEVTRVKSMTVYDIKDQYNPIE